MRKASLFGGLLVAGLIVLGMRGQPKPAAAPIRSAAPPVAASTDDPNEKPIAPGCRVEFRGDCWGAKTQAGAATVRRLERDDDQAGIDDLQRAGVVELVRSGDRGVVQANSVTLARVAIERPNGPPRLLWVRVLDCWPIGK